MIEHKIENFINWVNRDTPTDKEVQEKLQEIFSSYNKELLAELEICLENAIQDKMYTSPDKFLIKTIVASTLNKYR